MLNPTASSSERLTVAFGKAPSLLKAFAISAPFNVFKFGYVDGDKLTADGLNLDEQMALMRTAVNAEMPAYSKIAKVEVMDQPFEKTPKMSIKRFMYK